MIPFQIIATAILLWLGFKQFLRFRKAPPIKILYQLRWFFITVLATLLVVDPQLPSLIAQKLGVGRGVDVVVYFALIWLLYQNYSLSQELDGVYRKIDEVVRKLATKDANTYEENEAVDKNYKER